MIRLLILSSTAFLSSCISISTSGVDADPIALVNKEETYRKAAEAGSKERAARLANIEAFVSDPSEPVSVTARALFNEVIAARNTVLAPRPRGNDVPSVSEMYTDFFTRDLMASFKAVRTHQERIPPTIVVIGTDALVSTTYPDNTIVISRHLVESQNPWLARAVAAHELAHHSDGHAIFNWLATEGRRKAVPRQVFGAVTKVTQVLPFSIDYNYGAQNMFVNLGKHPVMFEFLADYWAYYTLKEMEAPEGSMSSALLALRDDVHSRSGDAASLEVHKLLDTRAKCMSLLDGFSPDPSLRSLDQGVTVLATESAISSIAEHTIATEPNLTTEQIQKTKDSVKQIMEMTRPAIADDAYWACATVAVLLPNSARTRALLAPESKQDVPAAFMQFAGSTYNGVDPLPLYLDIFDGIPLLEAGKLYRRPKSAPDLYVRAATYRGFQDGWHHVEVTLANGGHLPTEKTFAIRATRAGKHARLTLCSAEQRTSRAHDCSSATMEQNIPKHESRTFSLFVQAPPDPPSAERLVTFSLDGCEEAPKSDPNDAAPVCEIREEWESNNEGVVRIGTRPNLVVTGAEGEDRKVKVTISNTGFSATKDPFEIRAYDLMIPFESSLCGPEPTVADSNCKGVWISEPLAPGESRTVDFFIVRHPKTGPVVAPLPQSYLRNLNYYVDACSGWTEFRNKLSCAIEEVDETDNLFSPSSEKK